MLAIDHEGFEVADWLAARGIAAFVLKYRVLETGSDEDHMETLIRLAAPPGQSTGLPDILRRMDEFASIPLADGLAAMSLVRDRAEEWGVQADRVGALGFSAGARLVVDLATHDETAVRPDFAAAIYGPGSARRVPADAPPLFIAAAADDPLFDGSVETHAAEGRPSDRSALLRARRPWIRHAQECVACRPLDRTIPRMDGDRRLHGLSARIAEPVGTGTGPS